MRYIINDKQYHFKSAFDTETGAYVRTGILDEHGKDTGVDPFMASYPHLIDVCEYFTGWGEFARDGVADFLEKAVAKDVDVDDVDAVRENFEGKLDEDAIESIVDQIENDSICQFSADITTTVLMADGKVEKKYSFEAEG